METVIKRFAELTTDELYDILRLRAEVFVVEQNCVYQDLDGRDQAAVHVWVRGETGILAYLRVMDRGVTQEYTAIGRVIAVRRQGLGTRALREGIRVAREHFGADRIYLETQVYARSLYEKQGFRQVSEEFLEDGIPHIGMLLTLDD